MRCDLCPLCPIAQDDVCIETEGKYGIEHAAACFGDESETKEGAARAWNRRTPNEH